MNLAGDGERSAALDIRLPDLDIPVEASLSRAKSRDGRGSSRHNHLKSKRFYTMQGLEIAEYRFDFEILQHAFEAVLASVS